MAELRIHQEKVTPENAADLIRLCPFAAISYENGKLDISSACKLCRMCVRKGPAGVIEFVEEKAPEGVDKSSWKGITVYADATLGPEGTVKIHPVSFELLGKAKELAKVTGHEVYALLITPKGADKCAKELLEYGADKVYAYEDPMFTFFSNTTFAKAFEDFIEKVRPSSVLVGATNIGRSLAPRVAAHFRTGLTADCTSLEMKENTDLVQIRPAFGGNIMAQIITTNTRPQFATVRYKIFQAQPKSSIEGLSEAELAEKIKVMKVDPAWEDKRIRVRNIEGLPPIKDISEAERIVAVGRGLKSPDDLQMARALADKLGAHLACSRALVETGWLDVSHQIGLSGKTVKPKLIITLGISGAVQFAAGMKTSDCIIAVNTDPAAPIFDIAHYCLVGDLYEVADELMHLLDSLEEA
ncbi:MAG: electron transfer flavoprotein subunit alpha [Firmicutes bacterium]|nr:electron transfer flavoprotein subunit alpha [Bacillota bacterium]